MPSHVVFPSSFATPLAKNEACSIVKKVLKNETKQAVKDIDNDKPERMCLEKESEHVVVFGATHQSDSLLLLENNYM
jgi:hypothetical protein